LIEKFFIELTPPSKGKQYRPAGQALANVARVVRFSSDRTISGRAREIGGVASA